MTDINSNTNSNTNGTNNIITPGRHHVSKTYIPLMLFRGFWTALLIAIVGAFNLIGQADNIMAYLNFKNIVFLVIIGLIVLMGILTFILWLSFKRLTWEITEDEIHIYKGLIIKKKSHIPFRRIHSVDIEAKILERIFGVVTVKLDTAAGSAGSEDAKIPALKLSMAEAIRAEIFRRKHEVVGETAPSVPTATGGSNILDGLNKENDNIRGIFAGAPGADLTPESEYRLTNKELILLCISNGKAFAIIFAGLYFIYEMIGVLHDVDEGLGETADELASTMLNSGPMILAFIFVIALCASLVISFVTRALTYGNFVARRYGVRIEISRGLLQKRSIGVAVERIQTLKVKQGLIQRILGYAEISLETASGIGKAGSDQETDPGVVIHPFIKVNRIDDYMSKMLREFNDRPVELEGLTGLAMRRSMVRYALWTVILVLLPLNIAWISVRPDTMLPADMPLDISIGSSLTIGISVTVLVIMIAIGWAVWKGRAYARNDNYVAMRKGILGRTRVYVPRKKIQFAMVAQNPFQKRVKLATIKANTAAMGSSFQSIKDVEIGLGNDYLGWVEHKKHGG